MPTSSEDDSDCSSVERDSTDDDYSIASSSIQPEAIAASETRAAFWSRLVFIAVLLITMVTMACVVYFYVSNAEEDKFEENFNSDVQKVFESFAGSLDHTLEAADSFMVSMVAFGKYNNATWPFVTIPDFAVQTAKVRSLTNAVVMSKYHLVEPSQRTAWEEYAATHNSWVDQGLAVEAADPFYEGIKLDNWTASDTIFTEGQPTDEQGPGPFFPSWQSAPIASAFAPYNWDVYPTFKDAIDITIATQKLVIGRTFNSGPEPDEAAVKYISGFLAEDEDPTEPFVNFYYPIIEGASDSVIVNDDGSRALEDQEVGIDEAENSNITKGNRGKVVGVMIYSNFWSEFLHDILPPGNNGFILVIGNDCNQTFTYEIMGPDARYLGSGDRHEAKYDSRALRVKFNMLYSFAMEDRDYTGLTLSDDYCPYWIKAYPSQTMEDEFTTTNPILYAGVTVLIFVFTSIVFMLYDYFNDKRQKKVMKQAVDSSAIVSSLFPSNVRDRLYQVQSKESKRSRLQTILSPTANDDDSSEPKATDSGPIADVFPATTVLFADIAGFTAWSSVREPSQVFTLLETLYGAFDAIAKKRHVFKVETIGDSYVAVTGLPEPNPDHALVMARFARDCRDKMIELVHDLEIRLGPGTGDLQLRFGLHSGPVTAGVLRGAKSRFQLFGDTVNTASRMESNGIKGRIHVSQSTADLLIAAGRQHWVTKREDLIEAKGKGKMQTYWVEPHSSAASSRRGSICKQNDLSTHVLDDKTQRMIDWNVDILSRLLRQIIASREQVSPSSKNKMDILGVPNTEKFDTPLDEVKEVIEFPSPLVPTELRRRRDENLMPLDAKVDEELSNYVSTVARMYHPHPFHNFEHAAHVTMSLMKLFSWIGVSADGHDPDSNSTSVHDHMLGITSDPRTQFACLFATLIHNVDHPGLPNAQLVQENSTIVTVYKNRSIEEQNSFDVAWNLLMDNSYSNFRGALLADNMELQYFRQLVVNSVMATDVLDKEFQSARHQRFMEAFSQQTAGDNSGPGAREMSRKATIVLEDLIQASVMAHTMQHSHIYLKWNERMFEEMYVAFLKGRTDTDPSTNWYTAELDFFDSCVIPLAQELKESGIFGAADTSNEYLTNALKNREEWVNKGNQGIADMIQKVKSLMVMIII